MTPEAAIIIALVKHTRELGEDFPPILWREKGDEQPPEFIMVDHLPNLSVRPMLDSTRQDLTGIYQLTLFRQAGEYQVIFVEQAGQIAAHFMDERTLTEGDYTLTITKADVGRGRADGTRWAVPVDIHYRLDA